MEEAEATRQANPASLPANVDGRLAEAVVGVIRRAPVGYVTHPIRAQPS
jgi:hypothetical protein